MAQDPTMNFINSEVKDQTLTILLNRPDKLNALSLSMYKDLVSILEKAHKNDKIKVVVISGNVSCFTAGNDLQDFTNIEKKADLEPILKLLYDLATFSKPLIAAVNGPAIGIGTTMLLHCDFVYAGTNAQFQLPFVKLGLTPEAGSSLILPNLCGYHKATELLMLGETFDANTANQIGFVNKVLMPNKTLDYALSIAEKLTKLPANAIITTKKLLKQHHTPKVLEAIQDEAKNFYECLQSKETQEIIKNFFNN